MENEEIDIVYSQAVIEFVAVSREICQFLENAGTFSRSDFIEKSRKALPLLYFKAGFLPLTEAVFEEGTEKFVTEDVWQAVHDSILRKMGGYNEYARVYDPEIKDTEDSIGSIAEDMADIYQDLKDCLMVYRLGTHELMNDALFECVQNYRHSWGSKLLNALSVLHSIVFSEGDLAGEDEENDEYENKNTGNWIISQRQKLWNERDE